MSDTGPPYPHPNPAPGSNAIGQFIIGVSSVGTIPTFDVWKTVIAQYANSPRLTDLILAFNAALDQTQNFDNFYDFEWNVVTAQGEGLDVWGRIVGVGRTLQLPSGATAYFGFEEAAGSWSGFNQSSFYSGGNVTSNFNLSDTDFRTLIFAKAQANISDDATPSINQLLLNLFPGRGACYVQDNGGMSLTYTFHFTLSAVELAIIGQTDILPNPVGVTVAIQQV